jgi:hypothetical protein
VLLSTAGRRWEPASALEMFFVTRKYRGTENIIYRCLSECKEHESRIYCRVVDSLRAVRQFAML